MRAEKFTSPSARFWIARLSFIRATASRDLPYFSRKSFRMTTMCGSLPTDGNRDRARPWRHGHAVAGAQHTPIERAVNRGLADAFDERAHRLTSIRGQ